MDSRVQSKCRPARGAVVAVFVLASTIALSAGNPSYPQVALTEAVVKQFIASYRR